MKTISLLTLGLLFFACEMLTGTKNTEPDPGVWTRFSSGIDSIPVYALAASGSYIFAGTNESVYRSTDDGQSWTGGERLPASGYDYVAALAVFRETVFAGFGGDAGALYLSTDNGQNWTEAVWQETFYDFAVSGENIFAAAWYEGVYLSTDQGESWTAVNSGLPNYYDPDPVPGIYGPVYALAVSGENIFAGLRLHDGGVYRSTDGGQSWTAANSGLPANTNVYDFAVSGDNIFAGTNEYVYLSTDQGESWTAVNSGLPEPTNTHFTAFAVSGENVFVGIYSGVYRFTLEDQSWTAVDSGFPAGVDVQALAVSDLILCLEFDLGMG